MKLLLLIFLLPFTSTPIGYRQLQWSDFKGKPPANTEASACTCTNIAIGYDTAYAIFIPERSWTKTNDVGLLRHEQGHFAITKWWANEVSWRIKFCQSVDVMLNTWRKEQARYDLETNHGQDTAAQRRWEEQIKL